MKHRLEIPRRISLTAQTAAGIRKAITDGIWTEFLPGERRLAELFQVSRPTIQAAVRTLTQEGWLTMRPRLPTRLIRRTANRRSAPGRLVCIVMHEPISPLASQTNWSLQEMRSRLTKAGLGLDVVVCDRRCTASRQRELEGYLRENHAVGCVLISINQVWQQWFSGQPIPALLLGSSYPAISLPSLDIDYRSVCQHAAGALLGRGHRRIALLIPDAGMAGELASEHGFRAAVERSGYAEACALIVRHSGTARSIATRLDALFQAPQPPTALLVAKPAYVLSAMIHLLARGLAVPERVSLIARDQDASFEPIGPRITHYAFDQVGFARRASRLVLQMVSEGHLPKSRHLVFPRFVAGATLARPAANGAFSG